MAAFRGSRFVPMLAAWLVSIIALASIESTGESTPAWNWVAAVVTLASFAAAALGAQRGVPAGVRHRLGRILLGLGGPLFALIALSGGTGSPAVLAAGPLLLGIAWRHGERLALAVSGGIAALLCLADLIATGSVDLPRLASSVAVILAIGAAPLYLARRTAAVGQEARERLRRVDQFLERRLTPHGSRAVAADLRQEAEGDQEQATAMSQLAELDRFLRDVRDNIGADEVIFWQWNAVRSTQLPVAWSTEDRARPDFFEYERWAPLVKWSAEGEIVQCLSEDDVAFFVAAPVSHSGTLHGVLSVSSTSGLLLSPQGAKEWSTRYAAHLGLMVSLLETRRDFKTQMVRTNALIEAAGLILPRLGPSQLGRAICDAMLAVTSGARAALVRWDAQKEAGVVESVSDEHWIDAPSPLAADSLVASQCRMGEPLLKQDARHLSRYESMYGVGEMRREVGSVAIVPLRRAFDVIGALVLEGERPESLRQADLKNLRLLGALGMATLEVAWDIEEVTRRSRTDQLTGLWNRRHFDEELERMLASSDRHGHPTSLLIADVDHFKRVNDDHGHAAGDSVLQQIAQTFRDGVRTLDVCARYGGEEIVVLLDQTGAAGAMELAERLRRAIEARPIRHKGLLIPVTASFGVATYPESAALRDNLFPAADAALYEAKAHGRNCVRSAPVRDYPTIG